MTHICIGKLAIIGADNGLSPDRHQAIIWTSARILLIGPLGTNFSEIIIVIQTFSLIKIRVNMLFVKFYPFRHSLGVVSSIIPYMEPHNTELLSSISMDADYMDKRQAANFEVHGATKISFLSKAVPFKAWAVQCSAHCDVGGIC